MKDKLIMKEKDIEVVSVQGYNALMKVKERIEKGGPVYICKDGVIGHYSEDVICEVKTADKNYEEGDIMRVGINQ